MTDTAAKEAQPFADMAARVDNGMGHSGAKFGGAFVVVPPTGDPMEVLILDSRQDAGQFWGILQAKCAMALREIALVENQAAFGGRR